MKCLVLNTGIAGLMSALVLRQSYAQALEITLVDSPEEEAIEIIRLGPEALNFFVRVLGFSLKELMLGHNPGIFYLGRKITTQDGLTSVITHSPSRALVGGMPVNHSINRLRRVGGRDKLEQYSLAARMIKANVMALPNKKGECPLNDDELGISVSLEHLRRVLLSRLRRVGVQLLQLAVLDLTQENKSVRAHFSDQTSAVFDWVISTGNNHHQFSQVRWCHSVQLENTTALPTPSVAVVFAEKGWTVRDALCHQLRTDNRSLGWTENSPAPQSFGGATAEYKNKASTWFGAQWTGNILSLSEYNYWGAEFLLDPLRPILSVIELLVKFLPEKTSSLLLARHFNDRMQEVAGACREYIAAHLIASSVAGGRDILSDEDLAIHLNRKEMYLSTGEPLQAAATIIGDDVWAAFWQAFSVYPRAVSLLLQSVPLEAMVQQLRDIDLNITEIIPRLPSHNHYISLLNGGEV
jgi:hypothetical protein